MSLKIHDAPGFSDDLTEKNKIAWSDWINWVMRVGHATLAPQFYNATAVDEKAPTADKKITWIAFPRVIKLQYPNDRRRWRAADESRDTQDEYCEWSIKRNAEGKMVKIVFCNEGPEYYAFLAWYQPETLIRLYQEHNPEVHIESDDLFTKNSAGKAVYNPKNKWNNSTKTGTIMHLIQPDNTLAAQINLGADGTILRKHPDGTPVTDRDELIRCGRFGGIERNSDPHIGSEINALARAGAMLTIKNPIGLYIDNITWGLIQTPDGDDPSKWWKWTRGTPGHYMRAEFEVPADKKYVLGDLLVRNNPLEFGGQLADIISIALVGRASDLNGNNQVEPIACVSKAAIPAGTFKVEGSGTEIRDSRA